MKREHLPHHKKTTSWEPVHKWYSDSVGDEGHYYHQKLVIPGVLRLLQGRKGPEEEAPKTLLDLACGQGVLARALDDSWDYVGVDISAGLIRDAKKRDQKSNHNYFAGDITEPLPTPPKQKFTHAAILLALQNIAEPLKAIQNASDKLLPGGLMVIVLNHPCFRIPRQSSWQVDAAKKLQFRRIDRYGSAMEIPIQANPSHGDQSANTLSIHHPLASYFQWLDEAGFVTEALEEWYSDKVSEGAAAKQENRARQEFPLFLALLVRKLRPIRTKY